MRYRFSGIHKNSGVVTAADRDDVAWDVAPANGIDVPSGEKLLEWLAVLCVAGISYHLNRRGDAWTIQVAPDDLAGAREVLTAHEVAHRNWPPQPAAVVPSGILEGGGGWPAFWGVHAVGLFYLWLGPYNASDALLRAAGAQRDALRAGEWWRAVTALMVHADIGHLTGNLLFLFLFAFLVCRIFGPGLGWFLILAAGAAGNGMVALISGRASVGVGASTACFGALGVLVAHGVAVHLRQTAQWRELWRRAWLPLGAGLALMGMTGGAPGTDVMAHLCGLLAGLGLAGGVAGGALRRPEALGQVLLALTTISVVAGCWWMAWWSLA